MGQRRLPAKKESPCADSASAVSRWKFRAVLNGITQYIVSNLSQLEPLESTCPDAFLAVHSSEHPMRGGLGILGRRRNVGRRIQLTELPRWAGSSYSW